MPQKSEQIQQSYKIKKSTCKLVVFVYTNKGFSKMKNSKKFYFQ